MTTTAPFICVACRHFRPNLSLTEDGPATCAAFPGGIPAEILDEGFDHRAPFPGDGGVRFELAPDAEDDLATYEALINRSVPGEDNRHQTRLDARERRLARAGLRRTRG